MRLPFVHVMLVVDLSNLSISFLIRVIFCSELLSKYLNWNITFSYTIKCHIKGSMTRTTIPSHSKILKTIKIHLNWLTHIGKSRKLFPKNGRWLKGFFGNYFQVNFMSTHEKIFFPKNGSWLRGFSGNVCQYLEKVSGNSPGSLPEFTKFRISFKIIDFGKSFRKIPRVMPKNFKIWKKSGKSFRDILWVTARFLEIVSGIYLYGLIQPHLNFTLTLIVPGLDTQTSATRSGTFWHVTWMQKIFDAIFGVKFFICNHDFHASS